MQIRLTLAVAALALCALQSPARADDIVYSQATTRVVQLQLAQAGYYHGRIDGLAGEETVAALVNFQHANGLYSNGKLNFATRDALQQTTAVLAANTHPALPVAGNRIAYATPIVAMRPLESMGDQGMRHPLTRVIPNRFAQVDVTQTGAENARTAIVYVNGQPALQVAGRDLQVSPTYNLGGEDAVILSVRDGQAACPARHFLLAVKAGGVAQPREIGACAANYDANIAQNALFVSFQHADGMRVAGTSVRYAQNNLTAY